MGPNALFDKSFLQSLSVDESVWFDHYFYGLVCPLFYVETLADLEKAVREGRTPEAEVGIIADKFPEMYAVPSVHHTSAGISNLLGKPVAMTGQILVPGGRTSRASGHTGVIFGRSPESEAFERWRRREFLSLEREIAKSWREALSGVNLDKIVSGLKGADGKPVRLCKSIDEAKEVAEDLIAKSPNRTAVMQFVLEALQVPRELHRQIAERWSILGYQALPDFAPYASHVATVEAFFQLSISSGLIGTGRASNRVDIAYLNYLPFCEVFVSSDRLHRRCATPFLRPDQQFVWGEDLKRELQALNQHFLALPEEVRNVGLWSFADGPPPRQVAPQLADIWEQHGWGNPRGTSVPLDRLPPGKLDELSRQIFGEMQRLENAPALSSGAVPPEQLESVTIKRAFREKKGSWRQVPRTLRR
jgi:hypothetical protein